MIVLIGDYIEDQYIFGTVERISPEFPIPIFKENIRLEDTTAELKFAEIFPDWNLDAY